MAIGYSPMGVPFKLGAEEAGGNGDLVQAISRGFTMGNQPRSQAEALLHSAISNKLEGAKVPYADKLAKATLEHMNALTERANRPAQPALSNLEKAMAGQQRIEQMYGKGSPQAQAAQQYISRLAQGSGGISVSFDPDTGKPLVQIGGAQGGRGKGGGLYQTEEGEFLTPPTGAAASNLQQRVVGAETVAPYIKKVTESLPQFQNPKKRGETYLEGLSNAFIGTNYKAPSELAGGKAAIKEASEGMLKSFGLNATGENRRAMEHILQPMFGESEEGYRDRVSEQAQRYVENKKYAASSLRRGISIGNAPRESTGEFTQRSASQLQEERQNDIDTAKAFETTPKMVLAARAAGVKNKQQMLEFLRSHQ